MGEILKIKKHQKNYVILDKTFIKDNRLSWKAKGVLGYLLSCPDGWNVNVNDLINHSTDGKCAIYSALKELTAYGYYKKVPIRDEKSRIIRWESTVSELPIESEFPEAEEKAEEHTSDTEQSLDKLGDTDDTLENNNKEENEKSASNITESYDDFPYSENQKVEKSKTENRENKKERTIIKNDCSNIKEYCASDDAPSSSENFFNDIWNLYPRKRGKAKISNKQKNCLYEIGQELFRAIERYKEELKIESWKQPQNGDTFFSVGYIDYLDANYVPLPKPQKSFKNSFNDFEQSEYDWDELETLLLITSI